jgi:hypothetical protein
MFGTIHTQNLFYNEIEFLEHCRIHGFQMQFYKKWQSILL